MDLNRLRESFYAALRIVGGVLFSFHGVQKIFGLLTDRTMPEVFTQAWLGGMIELVAGALIALGFVTRGAAFLASGTMAVAYVQFHWKFAFDSNFFPIMNKGELALLYCFLFLYFVAAGDGPVSLGSLLKRRASGRSAS